MNLQSSKNELILNLVKYINMKELVNVTQKLVVKNWCKLIIIIIVICLILNYNDLKKGFIEGYKNGYSGSK